MPPAGAVDAIDRVRVHRLEAALVNRVSLTDAQLRGDIQAPLAELARLREENECLRDERARAWGQANQMHAPAPTTRLLDVAAWSAVVVVWAAAIMTAYAAWRAVR